jgi:hypothetical protein
MLLSNFHSQRVLLECCSEFFFRPFKMKTKEIPGVGQSAVNPALSLIRGVKLCVENVTGRAATIPHVTTLGSGFFAPKAIPGLLVDTSLGDHRIVLFDFLITPF